MSDSELEAIPPMYCKDISWKTFIRPMPKHFGWDKGWGLLGDVIMRFPLVLITRCYSVNFYSNDLQELLQHPIKRSALSTSTPPPPNRLDRVIIAGFTH